jgi:uncharacterized protein
VKRIHELDALRGFALFGILLVNVFVFHAPIAYYSAFYGAFEGVQADTVGLVVNFAGGKFLFIFAFLFGYGMVLQERTHGKNFTAYFSKRMLVLLLFGSLHILLFWFGDILASYALLGLLALPLLNLSNRAILVLATFFILFRAVYYVGTSLFGWPFFEMEQPMPMEEYIKTFQQGSYAELFYWRIREFWAFMPDNLVWYIPKTFGLFFIGIYAARKNLFQHIRANQRKYLLVSSILFIIGTAWIYSKAIVFSQFDLSAEPHWRPILIAINVVFETSLGLSYILGFSILFQCASVLTRILGKTGRMALTNYILQSLICMIIFYGYGFGYYGELKPTDLVFIALIIFSFNLVFSSLYLRYRNIGPLEYVWRRLIKKKS